MATSEEYNAALADKEVFQKRWNDAEERVKSLALQVRGLTDALERARTHTGLEADGCPLCTYVDGVFTAACAMHRKIEGMEAQISEERKSADGFRYRLQVEHEIAASTEKEIKDLKRLLHETTEAVGNIRTILTPPGPDAKEIRSAWNIANEEYEQLIQHAEKPKHTERPLHQSPLAESGYICVKCGWVGPENVPCPKCAETSVGQKQEQGDKANPGRRLTTPELLDMIILTTRIQDAVDRFSKGGQFPARYPELARAISASKDRYHSAALDRVEVLAGTVAGRVMVTFRERDSYVTVVGSEEEPDKGCGLHTINATANEAKEMIDRVIEAWDIAAFRPNNKAAII